jgi:hypothetical protein
MNYNFKNKTPLKYNSRISSIYKSNIFFKEENLSIGQSYKYRLINDIIQYNYKKIIILCYHVHLQLFSDFLHKYIGEIYIYCPKSSNTNIKKYKNVHIIDNDTSITKTIAKAAKLSNEKNIPLIDTIFEKNENYYDIYKETINQIDDQLNIDYIIISGCHHDLVISTLEYFKNYKNTKVICGKLHQQKKIINNNYAFPNKKELSKYNNYEIININENEYINHIIDTYINDSYIIEYTSAVSGAVLNKIKDTLVGKNVVCIINDNNNNIDSIINILNKYKNKQI